MATQFADSSTGITKTRVGIDNAIAPEVLVRANSRKLRLGHAHGGFSDDGSRGKNLT